MSERIIKSTQYVPAHLSVYEAVESANAARCDLEKTDGASIDDLLKQKGSDDEDTKSKKSQAKNVVSDSDAVDVKQS